VRKAQREGRELFCKPCRNQERFEFSPHPKKGSGVCSDKEKLYARSSFYKAKRRCKLGETHHPAYKGIEFRFNSFDDFYKELGARPEGYSLDRINTLGHYEPGNVRWASAKQQAQNRMPKGYWK